jgi:galactokinase
MNAAAKNLIQSTRLGFEGQFQARPRVLACAPGRVNIIGGHTDYNQGFVLPCAVEMYVVASVRARSDGRVVARSRDFAGACDFHIDDGELTGKWHDAIKGVIDRLRKHGGDLPGLSLHVAGDVPAEVGLASSAAFMVSLVMAVFQLAGIKLTPRQAATTAREVEVEFFGVHCGILDQMASAACREGFALLLDCRDLSTRDIPMPGGLSLLVGDTTKKRKLAGGSDFNRLVIECAQAVDFLAKNGESVESLRDADLEMLAKHEKEMPEILLARARHIVKENARVMEAVKALQAADIDRLGALVSATHASLRDDYEISRPELDAMTEAMTAHPMITGARLIGAGFGGCALGIVKGHATQALIDDVSAGYRDRTGLSGRVIPVTPGPGAWIVKDLRG